MKYKITVEAEDVNDSSEYDRYKTVYEQIVEGDQTIVNGVVRTVLNYTTFRRGLNQADPLTTSKD